MRTNPAESPVESDVLIVGYGPVGQLTALLLGRCGWRVTVLERWTSPYQQPRAVHFDDEVARYLASLGLTEEVAGISEISGEYVWRNAEGETLLDFDRVGEGPNAWPRSTNFSQPDLEAVLMRRAEQQSGVTVLRGLEAVSIDQSTSGVRIRARGAADGVREFDAQYLIGCDGANSCVRRSLNVDEEDLGYFFDWLIVDVIPLEEREWRPHSMQVCDPTRPTTVVSGGPGRRRWEFMLLDGEEPGVMAAEASVWSLLAPWGMGPANARLERHTVYRFQARWATAWRVGRVLLAGDAAHLMPPFAGQGLCSGMRDAVNLSWKLDLVLRGMARPSLLDTYSTERLAHSQHAIRLSVALGQIMCITDPAAAAARDEKLVAAGGNPRLGLPELPPARLGPGVIQLDSTGEPALGAGLVMPQSRVRNASGEYGRFDEVIGLGWMLICRDDPTGKLSPDSHVILDQLGASTIYLSSDACDQRLPGNVRLAHDVHGDYRAILEAYGYQAMIIRPDFYVYGGIREWPEAPEVLGQLCAALELLPPAVPPRPLR